ncbi:MAG TPA: hypothetical protein VEX70_14170 [Pyrinomonadaceae bacterium]|nr:hypothetical protein [Pyrinomonadaceae bacterium]
MRAAQKPAWCLLEFAANYLKVDYLFREYQEPFYSGTLMPFPEGVKCKE